MIYPNLSLEAACFNARSRLLVHLMFQQYFDRISFLLSFRAERLLLAISDVDAELASGPVHNCELHIQVGRLDSHLYLWGVQATISTNNVYLPLEYLGFAWYGYLGYSDLVNNGSHMMNLVDVEFSCQYGKRIY